MDFALKHDTDGVEWSNVAEFYTRAFEHAMSPEKIASVFKNSYCTRLALVGGIEIGGVYALCDGSLDAAIFGLAVRPDFQGRGIGTALMRSIVAGLPPSAAIILTADSPRLVGFYRKLGFGSLKIAMALRYPAGTTE